MHFGRYSILLAVGALNGFALAALLWRRGVNRAGNRTLGLLVALVGLRLVPYILGYAGAYDRYRWLTFAPFELSFSFGPLLWAYVVALTTGHLPDKRWPHAVLPALQIAYSLVCFALPMPAKWDWYSGTHMSVVEPLGVWLALLSIGAYLYASWRALRRYHRWLDDVYSTTDAWQLTWLYQVIGAVAVVGAVGLVYGVVDWAIVPLDYFDRLPMMIAFALLAYVLGALGWRYGETVYPQAAPEPVASGEPANVYAQQSHAWAAQVFAAEWWRDDTLTLTVLAQRLDTSSRTLSRVLSEGGGQTFHEFVNRMRIRAITTALANPHDTRDMLAMAMEAGFSSKASFNRVFKRYTGMTPSAYRAQARTEGLAAPIGIPGVETS